MIEEQAVVIFKEDDQVSVEIMRTKPCGLCGKTQGCGNSIWGKIFSHKRNMLSIKNNIGVKVGDRVMLTIEENYLLRSSLLLYGLPLLFLFIGMVFMDTITQKNSDLWVLVGAIFGMLSGLILVKFLARKNHDRLYKEAMITKI
ncbi:SoxR reducing system RseC family protein [Methylophilaceae bacterium]|jgi:sigma-E factor negative regulatory protein RseC|nr:SoxR reducing system RseC family protein [Nitrosomonadales bacterium]MCH9781380.1 SoxR reducing system RseC family protein [Betaproteobacteria bacterium]MDA9088020.1 SoxR reducing system RseC family protein [Methylophilaceae bacterium]MCH9842407.1 SoxR reducing system RseC family protein [Betaproteobacteria bacterium]MDA9819138.1 SoxR reducing system RseC family protein [Methylophilaceae bacterium]